MQRRSSATFFRKSDTESTLSFIRWIHRGQSRFRLITASADPAIAAEAEALGADAFLVKPFTMQTLRDKIAAMPLRVSASAPAA
jgi:hypothetical protein